MRRIRQSKWRPLRGFLFSFMASSAFYPITYACFVHGYSQMDIEAGAARYALTVLLYLSAVTIYGASCSKQRAPAPVRNANLHDRPEFRKRGDQDGLTRGDNRTRFFTCSWLLASQCTFRHLLKHFILRIP